MDDNSRLLYTGDSPDGLEKMLKQRSSSRIGRLNKNSQNIAIKYLTNESNLTRDQKRRIMLRETSKLATLEVDTNLKEREELIQSVKKRCEQLINT